MEQRKLVCIGPRRLQEAFTVMVEPVRNIQLLAYCSDLNSLVSCLETEVPEIVLGFVDWVASDGWIDYEQAGQVKGLWPCTSFIALIRDVQLGGKLLDLGVDAVLVEGAVPAKLLGALEAHMTG